MQISTKNSKNSVYRHEFNNAFVAGTRNVYISTLFCSSFFPYKTRNGRLTNRRRELIYNVSSCNIKLHNLRVLPLAFFTRSSEVNTCRLFSSNFIINLTQRRTQNRFVNVSIVIIDYSISALMLLLSSYGNTTGNHNTSTRWWIKYALCRRVSIASCWYKNWKKEISR